MTFANDFIAKTNISIWCMAAILKTAAILKNFRWPTGSQKRFPWRTCEMNLMLLSRSERLLQISASSHFMVLQKNGAELLLLCRRPYWEAMVTLRWPTQCQRSGNAHWLSLVFGVFLCFCHFPMWCPGSGVVLDCIDSWSLPFSLRWCDRALSNKKWRALSNKKYSRSTIDGWHGIQKSSSFVAKIISLMHWYIKRISTPLYFSRIILIMFKFFLLLTLR